MISKPTTVGFTIILILERMRLVAQQVKALAVKVRKPKFHPQKPWEKEKKLTSDSCLLTSTLASVNGDSHIRSSHHTHTYHILKPHSPCGITAMEDRQLRLENRPIFQNQPHHRL